MDILPQRLPWNHGGMRYAVTLWFDELDGRLEATKFMIEQWPRTKDRRRGLTSEVLKAVPLQSLVTQGLENIYSYYRAAQEPLPRIDEGPFPNLRTYKDTDDAGRVVFRTVDESPPPTPTEEALRRNPDRWANREEWHERMRTEALEVIDLVKATGSGTGRRWGDTPEARAKHHEQVLEVYDEAKHFQQPTTRAVAEAFGLELPTALKHIERAKKWHDTQRRPSKRRKG